MVTNNMQPVKNEGLGVWMHRRRVKSADLPALIHRDQSITYDALASRVARLADALIARGVQPGERIAYLGNNHPAFVETLFACGLAGAIFVPLNTRLAARELEFMLRDSGSRMLVNAEPLNWVARAAADAANVPERLVVEEPEHLGTLGDRSYELFLRGGEDRLVDLEVGPDDVAFIIYTSGTTGKPKGAALTHGNVIWNCLNVLVDYDVTSDARGLMIAPLFHVASLGMGCLPTLLKGGTVILEEKFEPGSALALIQKHKATAISGVPTTFQLLCEHPDWDSTDISSLRNLTCGGSAVPMRVLEAYEKRGLSFSGGYGMTETAPGLTSLQPRYSRLKAGSAGLPHFFSHMRVVDEKGRDAEPHVPGEILARGPNVIDHYWNRPDASADSYTSDGWLRTGDVGYVDEQGFLYISDRIKDMIISGGENIYSAEVEAAIMELAEVEAAAVIGIPDEKWGEVPHAVLILVDGAQLDADRFIDHLCDRLARYKVPKTFEVVDEFPRTSSGKIQKQVLRAERAGA